MHHGTASGGLAHAAAHADVAVSLLTRLLQCATQRYSSRTLLFTQHLRMASDAYRAADVHKQRGNALFGEGQYGDAIAAYTCALDTLSSGGGSKADEESKGSVTEDVNDSLRAAQLRAVVLSNRAMCQLKLSEWGHAVEDASAALHADSSQHKALYRRAMVRLPRVLWFAALLASAHS